MNQKGFSKMGAYSSTSSPLSLNSLLGLLSPAATQCTPRCTVVLATNLQVAHLPLSLDLTQRLQRLAMCSLPFSTRMPFSFSALSASSP
jgi:hypothetical protein